MELTATVPEPNGPEKEPPLKDMNALFPAGVAPIGINVSRVTDMRKENSSSGRGRVISR